MPGLAEMSTAQAAAVLADVRLSRLLLGAAREKSAALHKSAEPDAPAAAKPFLPKIDLASPTHQLALGALGGGLGGLGLSWLSDPDTEDSRRHRWRRYLSAGLLGGGVGLGATALAQGMGAYQAVPPSQLKNEIGKLQRTLNDQRATGAAPEAIASTEQQLAKLQERQSALPATTAPTAQAPAHRGAGLAPVAGRASTAAQRLYNAGAHLRHGELEAAWDQANPDNWPRALAGYALWRGIPGRWIGNQIDQAYVGNRLADRAPDLDTLHKTTNVPKERLVATLDHIRQQPRSYGRPIRVPPVTTVVPPPGTTAAPVPLDLVELGQLSRHKTGPLGWRRRALPSHPAAITARHLPGVLLALLGAYNRPQTPAPTGEGAQP